MNKNRFSINHNDEPLISLVRISDHKILAIWAIECTRRVLPYFEEKFPKDHRPQQALKTLQTWIDTGIFKMTIIRHASLEAHRAAREVGEDNPARSAARAAGQAVATAHVSRHAYGSAIYAQQAIHRATNSSLRDEAVIQERNWQYGRLLELGKIKREKQTC